MGRDGDVVAAAGTILADGGADTRAFYDHF